jgi:DNA-binding transcriptional LysR family regulator
VDNPLGRLSEVNLNRLRVFVSAVEAGSLTAAAARLGIAKTMASAHVQRLEAEVGANLLVRTTRRLNLTEAGEAFYQASRRILRDAEEAVLAAASSSAEPCGTLRVSATIDYGAGVVAPLAVELQRRYPALKIDLSLTDRVVDLAAEGIDVSIRVGELADSGYRAARIGSFSELLVAAPEILRRAKAVKVPSDLADFPFVALSVLAQPAAWTFRGPSGKSQKVRFMPTMSANAVHAVRMAALAGGGLAVLPDFAVAQDLAAGRLAHALPQWTLRTGGIHAVFHATRHPPQKVRALIEALRERGSSSR